MNSKTDLSNAVRPLAEAMKAKKLSGVQPYVLCLGEGATLSSGCREMRSAVRDTIADECPRVLDEVLVRLGRSERCGNDRVKFNELLRTLSEDEWYDDLLDDFFKLLDKHNPQDRQRRLNVFLGEHYPSYGYDFLALLAREGFFDMIVNANYDPLLQIALGRVLPPFDSQGRPRQPYEQLISREDGSFKREIEEALIAPTPRIKAIWLHGHLDARSGIAFTDEEKGSWYHNVQEAIEKLFGKDLLLIGYTDRDSDIRRAVENARGNGNIWYVAPKRPSRDIAKALRSRKHHESIECDFDSFCHMLFDLALDLIDPLTVQKGTHNWELLKEKTAILREYVATLERRQAEDPMAPPTLQAYKEAIEQELNGIQAVLNKP